MIAEGTVIGMLLYGHYLNAVIAVLNDTWQHIILELGIGTHFLSILPHTHVTLVNEEGVLLGLKNLFLELVGLLGIPHLCRENLRIIILHHTTAPGWNTLPFSTIPLHFHLVQLSMLESLL